ncbi:class I SAM-dependent methyltransferase [Thiotrichales bacterium 19X7-9]|nr:class I SAM-dependent methyltransferase [Thiotrichales bacterium 19X7-9]
MNQYNFDEISKNYSNYCITQKKAAIQLLELVKYHTMATENVLDIGCATGCNANELKSIYDIVEGIDNNINMVNLAKNLNIYQCIYHNDIQYFQSPKKYSALFCNSVFYYFNKPRDTINNLKNLMNENTILALQYQYKSAPQLLKFIKHAKSTDLNDILKLHKYSANQYSEKEVKQLCKLCNLTIKHIECRTDKFEVTPDHALNIFNSGWCNPWLNMGYPFSVTEEYKCSFRNHLLKFYHSLCNSKGTFTLEVPRLYLIASL